MAMRTAIGPTQMPFSFTAWLYNSGGTYFESYDAATHEYRDPALDSAAAADALELYTRIIQDHGPKGARNWQVSDITKAFLSGGVAMIQEGSPFGATINDPEASSVAGKVGAFAVPPGSAGQFVPSATQAWGINAYGKAPEAAWLFAQWATSPEILRRATMEQSFSAPPTPALYADPEFVARYDFEGYLEALSESAATKSSPIGGPYIPTLANWSEVGNRISVELNKVVNGQATVRDGLRAANDVLAG